jgi:hypothetical protein
MIDQFKKAALIQHIKQQNVSSGTEILLSPDLYFDGYDDAHCTICANNTNSISTFRFATKLREIEQHPEVLSVFVRFYEYSDAEEFEDAWIGSDSIYIVTKANLDAIRNWFSDFEISDVWEERDLTKFAGLTEIPNGFRLAAVWWD